METNMITFSKVTAGLVLGLIVTSAVPSFAGSRSVPPGYNARAQVIEQGLSGDGMVSPHRARALRDCNDRAGALTEYTWGVRKIEVYRACMAERGEVE
jgi:hypothetical protein